MSLNDMAPLPTRLLSLMTVGQVREWLVASNFDTTTADIFKENEIDGNALLLLDEHDLKKMGMAKVGLRKKLLRAVNAERANEIPPPADLPATPVPPIFPPRATSPRALDFSSQGGGGGGDSDAGPISPRRIQEQVAESINSRGDQLYIKGVSNTGTVRLVRINGTNMDDLRQKFREEFNAPGTIVYRDAEGDEIPISKEKDLEYAVLDAQQRGTLVKFQYKLQ